MYGCGMDATPYPSLYSLFLRLLLKLFKTKLSLILVFSYSFNIYAKNHQFKIKKSDISQADAFKYLKNKSVRTLDLHIDTM